jgi:hypothetical protein
MKLKSILLAISLVFTMQLAKAQAVANFTPSHIKAAEDMLLASGIDKNMNSIFDNVIHAFSNNVPTQHKAKFTEVLTAFLNKYMNWDSLKDKFAVVYAEEFSESELKQLTEFFNTPIGKKMNEKLPVLQQKGMLIGQQVIKDHQAELQSEIEKNFKTE